MSSAIQINPETGRKIFNTRAAKANEKITGKGYSTINDDSLTSLPPPLQGLFSMQPNRQNIENLKRHDGVLLTIWH